jgi:CII-binding regulator of phage lambda lysogenization HflD
MSVLKREGNVLLNTDTDAYTIAKKRKEMQRDRKKKDELLESLNKRVLHLEEQINVIETQMKDVVEKLGNIYDIS